jgi:hypothetical protein
MQLRWTGLLAGALVVAAAGSAAAQNSVALTPYLGYINPTGSLVEQNSPGTSGCCLELKGSGGLMVGGIIELTLAKSLSISGFASSTLGLTQKATFDYSSLGGPTLELGMATTQFGGTLRLLPMGRNPSGAPKGFFLEGGAAYELLAFSDVQDRSGGSTTSPSWNSSGIVGVFGGGVVFNVGRRANLTIFGRYHMPFAEYTSDGLDDWNSVPPPDTPKKAPTFFIGVGLRTGR